MHALRPVPADLPHVFHHQDRAAQPAGAYLADAGHRRRAARNQRDVRRGNVFLPGLPGLHERLPRRGELRRAVRERARRSRGEQAAQLAQAQPHSPLHDLLAVHGPWPPAIGRAADPALPGAGLAGLAPEQRRPALAAPTPPGTGSHDAHHPAAIHR